MTPSRVLQLKVTMKGIKPAIWRRILVSQDTTLEQLHLILQVAMGWMNCHLHGFTIQGQRFGPPSPDDFMPIADERKHRIGSLVLKGHKLEYEYDFGDGWEHTILVEDVREATPSETVPSCLDGRRACPPEDCGGPHRYADVLDALRGAKGKREAELLEWLGGRHDPERFELAKVNDRLAELLRPRRRTARAKPPRRASSKPARSKRTLH